MKIDDLLRTATRHGRSDLHFESGRVSRNAHWGELHTVADAPRLRPEDTLDMSFSIMSNRQKQRFKEVSEVDIAYGVNGLGRFRATSFSSAVP